MPTNEERREIASNLRKMVEEKNGIYNALDASPFANICSGLLIEYKVGPNDYAHCCDVMLRIADLIEPEPERTCRVVSIAVDIDGERMTDYTCCFNQPGWNNNFCPNCGAKVVK